ncbi:MAG: orotate phosphoribosyltransferase [Gammaproteobacteria bacterium]|nr:orotate phosphoribosyltransferase [Gammaproteobacteria bacterium]
MTNKQLILSLYQIGSIKLGQFTLKSGQTSPVYIDLRQIISYPDILRSVSNLMWESVRASRFDLICGIPYTALPIATCMSLQNNIAMVMRRKEKKDYGTKQLIEGAFTAGQTCLLVEDVITTGSSVIETAKDLEDAGLIIQDVVVLIDREAGGKKNLQDKKYLVHAAITLSDIYRELLNTDVITDTERELLHHLQESIK